MSYKPPRLLREDEISCRVQKITEYNGNASAQILLYKDARVDMNILDETYTPMGWQRKHFPIDGNLYCGIEVWDDDKKQWVMKQDVGTESNTEATKGEASDSFKRSGTNWGIGRELYTAPKGIFINLEKDEWKAGSNGKPQTTYKFDLRVSKIDYNDKREIIHLILTDKKGKVRFSFGDGKLLKADEPYDAPVEQSKPKPPVNTPVPVEKAKIDKFVQDKTPAKVSAKCDEVEYKRRRKMVVDLLNEVKKTPEEYAAEVGDTDIGVMTLQEFTVFLKDLKAKWA